MLKQDNTNLILEIEKFCVNNRIWVTLSTEEKEDKYTFHGMTLLGIDDQIFKDTNNYAVFKFKSTKDRYTVEKKYRKYLGYHKIDHYSSDDNFIKFPYISIPIKSFRLWNQFSGGSKHNTSVDSLLFHGEPVSNKSDGFIIPDYQRALVWTPYQESAYISSILNGTVTGIFVFNRVYYDHPETKQYRKKVVVIDGQQRLNTIKKFLRNAIPEENGRLYREMSQNEKVRFVNYADLMVAIFDDLSIREEIKIYLALNTGGTVHTEDELTFAKEYLRKITIGEIK